MKITIELNPSDTNINQADDMLVLDAIARVLMGRPIPIDPQVCSQPPQCYDSANSQTRTKDPGQGVVVSVYTAEGKEDEAVSNMTLDDAVEKVEVQAATALAERATSAPVEEASTEDDKKTRKRRTKQEIAMDIAEESGNPVPFEFRGKKFVAHPNHTFTPVVDETTDVDGQPNPPEATSAAPEATSAAPPEEAPVETPLDDTATTEAADAAIDAAVAEGTSKPAPPNPPAEANASELRKLT